MCFMAIMKTNTRSKVNLNKNIHCKCWSQHVFCLFAVVVFGLLDQLVSAEVSDVFSCKSMWKISVYVTHFFPHVYFQRCSVRKRMWHIARDNVHSGRHRLWQVQHTGYRWARNLTHIPVDGIEGSGEVKLTLILCQTIPRRSALISYFNRTLMNFSAS